MSFGVFDIVFGFVLESMIEEANFALFFVPFPLFPFTTPLSLIILDTVIRSKCYIYCCSLC